MQTTFFTGVHAGYSNEQVVTPDAALQQVADGISLVRRSGIRDTNQYAAHSAYIVYDPELNCPEGGEIGVAVTTSGKISSVMKIAEALRSRLEQSSLSVAGAPEDGVGSTKSMRLEIKGDAAAIAKLWQEKATEVKNKTITADNEYGTYVSVGVYADVGSGKVIIQGEANPRYFPDEKKKKEWEKAAIEVAKAVTDEFGQEVAPTISGIGFNYLRAPDKKNSRGEGF